MQIVWSRFADHDMAAIADFIALDNPFAAIASVDTIGMTIKALKEHPKMGRAGRVHGTRELVIAGLPYIAIYREHPLHTIEIVRVLHGAQQWPKT